jgi:hypothetical protein
MKGQMKGHEQDKFDGGRAASLVSEPPQPKASKSATAQEHDFEGQALALALLALTEGGDLGG